MGSLGPLCYAPRKVGGVHARKAIARSAAKRAGVGKSTIRVTRSQKGRAAHVSGPYVVVRAGQAAFIMAQSGERVTYGELDARTNRLAHLFRAAGLRRLDHYSIFMESNVRYVESCGAGETIAAARRGAD
jgi:non-ribosomal peptide synthetase component F